MKVLRILVFIFFCSGLSSVVKAQACGFTFLTIYLTDSKGQSIKNAKIETFDKSFKEKYFLYPEKENSSDAYGLERPLAWSEQKQAYFGSEGMCGGHQDVGFRFTAEGFEKFEILMDLPLGWTGYSIKLRSQNSPEQASFVKLVTIRGKITDYKGQSINKVKIFVFEKDRTVLETEANLYGLYELYLPRGTYNMKFAVAGFKTTVIENFEILDGKNQFKDLILEDQDIETLPNTTDN